MFKSVARRLPTALLSAGLCLLAAGCLSGNPSYFPYFLPGGPAVQTHPKPAGQGYFADYDPHACRVELRPGICSAPVRSAQVFIATVYDSEGTPRRKRRVEWMVEGPGSIIEVDESGYLPGRGMKIDNKFAFSHTDYLEHCLNRGGQDFTIGPGQTWCVVSSPVEGETVVTAYVPAITDWNKNRAYSRVAWTEGNLLFPPPVTARAGGECTIGTKVANATESYRIRYRIVDGPPAALFANRGAPVDSVTEAFAPIGSDGTARISVAQPAAATGTNRIAIEVVKPNADNPGQFTVVSKGETKITWQASQSDVRINAPRTLALNQDALVGYAVKEKSTISAGPATLVATVPAGMNLIRTEPRAVVDGDQLIWTLKDSNRSVSAVFRPMRVGPATLAVDLRGDDGSTSSGSTEVTVTEAKLLVKLEGPSTGLVGETLPFTIRVTNTGEVAADKVRVQAQLDEGLKTTGNLTILDETISSIESGQSRTISLPVTAKQGGKFTVQVGAASGSLTAIPQTTTIEVKDVQFGLTVHGPAKGYIGEEVTWQLVIRNTGDVTLGRVVVSANLPAEVSFVKATDGGKLNGKQVVWELDSAPPRQERTIAVTGLCDKLSGKATLKATASALPQADAGTRKTNRPGKSISPEKPAEASLEIVGMPALQISVKDSNDPIVVGQRTTYVVRVKNAGTQAATKVVVSADVPSQMRPVRATGPLQSGTIAEQKVTFPALATLAPNAEATFVIEVEGRLPGDARFRAEARSPQLTQPVRAEEPTRVMVKESSPGGR